MVMEELGLARSDGWGRSHQVSGEALLVPRITQGGACIAWGQRLSIFRAVAPKALGLRLCKG